MGLRPRPMSMNFCVANRMLLSVTKVALILSEAPRGSIA